MILRRKQSHHINNDSFPYLELLNIKQQFEIRKSLLRKKRKLIGVLFLRSSQKQHTNK